MSTVHDDHQRRPRPVVVAVGRSPCEAALEVGVAEAARRGRDLRLVQVAHAAPGSACGPEDPVLREAEARRAARAALDGAARRARDLVRAGAGAARPPGITTVVVDGPVVAALRSLSRRAELVVVERGVASRTGSGSPSVTAGIATAARCPVLVVPTDWHAAPASAPVVVGVRDERDDRVVVRHAVREAELRGVRVVELHVDDGSPASALLARAAEDGASLIVLGRHHRGPLVGAPLGTTSRDVVARSTVPVLVVDPPVPISEPS